MRILFIDDDPEHVQGVGRILRDALDLEVFEANTVQDAVDHLQSREFDLVVIDIFIPLGARPNQTLGPRARRYAESLPHLGGLVLLDELDRLQPAPKVLAHTACTDHALLEVLGDQVLDRIPKPAPLDVLLNAVLRALDLPAPQSK